MKCAFPGCGHNEDGYPCDDTCHPDAVADDEINAPSHYVGSKGTQAIDIIEEFELNFRLGGVVKYILRHEKKGRPLHDLKKAQFFLNREIAKREEAGEK